MDQLDKGIQKSIPAISSVTPIKDSVGSSRGDVDAIKKVEFTFRDRLWIALKAYSAALVTVGVMMPVIASLVAAGLYLFYTSLDSVISAILKTGAYNALIFSSLFTGALWLVVAIPFSFLCTARNANPRNYSLLSSRLHQLQASLGLKGDVDVPSEEFNTIMKAAGFDRESDRHTWSVMQEAYVCCMDISRRLKSFPIGLAWSEGTGYNSAWTLLHHAEEAMIEVTDVDTALRGAIHDFLAIHGSQIDSKDGLLANVIRAVAELKLPPKEAEQYLKEHQPGKMPVTLSQLTELIHHSSGVVANKGIENAHPKTEAEVAARITLREVRSTLNSFRDNRWEGFVRQRGRLLRAIAVTGIVTYVSICFVLASGPPPDFILAATLFYIVGAIAGLFVRFYHESRGSTPVDDFGLTTIRLLAIPLLSGLAAIGGVILTVTILRDIVVPLGSSLGIPITLPTSFFSIDPNLLLVASFFGLTPNLLINRLQKKSSTYEANLQSTEITREVEKNESQTLADPLEQIYRYDLSRAIGWFRVTLASATLGFLLLLIGAIMVLMGKTTPGFVASIAGGISEAIAIFSFWRSKKANELADSTMEKIRETATIN
jgi:hypothetical protein